jgi:hypothetical protein
MGDRNCKHRNGTKFQEVPSGSIGKMEAGIGSNEDLEYPAAICMTEVTKAI